MPRPQGNWFQEDTAHEPYPVQLSEPIHTLTLRPQGCFAVSDRTVDLLAKTDNQIHARRILQRSSVMHCAIEPQGRWIATVTTDDPTQAILQLTSTSTAKQTRGLPHRPLLQSLQAGCRLLQLLAIDSRHMAVVLSVPRKSTSAAQAGAPSFRADNTVFKIYTRRGTRVGTLATPLHPGPLISTPTPYRLVGLDQDDPYSVLIIDLKPYRISRIRAAIIPQFLAATGWGFVLADAQGHIALLDSLGQQVGALQGPSGITAIACFNHSGLLVATWNGHAGALHTINLSDVNVDILF